MVTEDVHLLMFEENIRCRQKDRKKVMTEQDIYNPNQISGLSYQIVTFGNCGHYHINFGNYQPLIFSGLTTHNKNRAT